MNSHDYDALISIFLGSFEIVEILWIHTDVLVWIRYFSTTAHNFSRILFISITAIGLSKSTNSIDNSVIYEN